MIFHQLRAVWMISLLAIDQLEVEISEITPQTRKHVFVSGRSSYKWLKHFCWLAIIISDQFKGRQFTITCYHAIWRFVWTQFLCTGLRGYSKHHDRVPWWSLGMYFWNFSYNALILMSISHTKLCIETNTPNKLDLNSALHLIWKDMLQIKRIRPILQIIMNSKT